MITRQRLQSDVHLSGLGIHSGQIVSCHIRDTRASGLRFFRQDLDNACIPVSPDQLIKAERCTVLENDDGVRIRTPEHLLAALAGLGVWDADIVLDAEEVPILDGSALTFASAILEAGLRAGAAIEPIVLTQPLSVHQGDAQLIALPAAQPQYTYVLDYEDHFVGQQVFTFFQDDDFVNDLAPARTYGFEAEVKALLEKGLAQGGSLDNAVVIGEDGYLNPLRFDDELARHKTLDLLGDMAILGRPLQAHVIGIKSGHAMSAELALKIKAAMALTP